MFTVYRIPKDADDDMSEGRGEPVQGYRSEADADAYVERNGSPDNPYRYEVREPEVITYDVTLTVAVPKDWAPTTIGGEQALTHEQAIMGVHEPGLSHQGLLLAYLPIAEKSVQEGFEIVKRKIKRKG